MSSNLFSNAPLYSYPTIPVVTASIPVSKWHKRTCSIAGCKNGIVQGGVCVSHGAKRRQCGFPGCTKSSKSAGMCSKHGPARKPCDTEGCTKISVRGTKCKMHAAPSQTCVMEGCRKSASFGGMCKSHHSLVLEGRSVSLKESAVGARIQMIQPIMAPMGGMMMMAPQGIQPQYCQMIAAQNMGFQGMPMGAQNVAIQGMPMGGYAVHPGMARMVAPGMGLASLGMGGGGYGAPLYAAYDPSEADAMAVSRVTGQKQDQGKAKFLDSFAMP